MIEAVPTSIAAFVGLAESGPIDEPTSVRSVAEFTRIFGGLSADGTMSYAIEDYFINGGSEAIVVRVANGEPGDETVAEVVPPLRR